MDKHEEHHRPEMQKGLVIKHNANQRYATSGVTAFLFKEVGKAHNLPTQVIALQNLLNFSKYGKSTKISGKLMVCVNSDIFLASGVPH